MWNDPQCPQNPASDSLDSRETEETDCPELEESQSSTATLSSQHTQTVSDQTVTSQISPIISPQDVNDQQAEDLYRLNQEISSLREEIERGDRQIKELEEQVADVCLINEDFKWLKDGKLRRFTASIVVNSKFSVGCGWWFLCL